MTDEKFVHLHNHSYYSLLDGLSSVKDLVYCAKDLGYKSLALTDHGTCAGLFQLEKYCKEAGIKPILGMEAYLCDNHTIRERTSKYNHLIILAKNKTGYNNLIRLSSLGYIDGFYYKPRIDFELLKKYKDGLIISSACVQGELPTLLLNGQEEKAVEIAGQYKDVFGDDFYIEIMMHSYDDKTQEEKEKRASNLLYKLSKKLGIKCIATQDTHYARKEDWEAHDILLCIQTIDVIKNPERFTFASKDFYLKPYEQMFDLYGKKAPELLLNTIEIAEKVETGLMSIGEDLLPNFKVPEGFKNEEEYLSALVENGMKQKGLYDKENYMERMKYELSVITRCKYTKYFLILWDIINHAKNTGLRYGAGRGSAVSSLCLYAMDITKLDPLKYDLVFERFLNPDRISPPDVDMDFDYDRRGEIYNYISEKYGAAYCCNIGTYNSLAARAAIRGTAKALDIGNDWERYQEKLKRDHAIPSHHAKIEMTKTSLNMADFISKQIPFKPGITIEKSLKSSREFRDSLHRFPKLREIAVKIEGCLASAGVHPAGILVCKDPVIERTPLKVREGVISSQFDGGEVEKLGLLKFDLLALKTLTVIDKTVKMIKERHGKDIDVDTLEPNDSVVFSMLSGNDPSKNTLGVFQLESDGMTKLLRDMRVDRFEDIVIANALYRPGPLKAGMHDMYCTYKHGRKKVEYLHPKIGQVLKETYGIMIYQEDIMKISRTMAGFTGGQSDSLRKAVGKKDKELLADMKKKFIDGCVKNNIDLVIAQKIFEQIEFFGDYGFNKSHSAAYSFISYQTAWLKCYYPLEFMCNLLTSEIGNSDKNKKLNMYIAAAEKMKIGCADPTINQSGLEFKIGRIKKTSNKEELGLIKPLTMLKGVGSIAVESIVKNQPYKNLEDFMKRTDARIVNVNVFTTLVESGCMDGAWGTSRELLLKQYPLKKSKLEAEKKELKREEARRKEFGGGSVFDESDKINI